MFCITSICAAHKLEDVVDVIVAVVAVAVALRTF